MLLLQRQRKAIYYRTKDFQKLCNAVEPFGLVGELEKDIVDRSPDVRAQIEKFAVYSMKRRFQKVSLARVF